MSALSILIKRNTKLFFKDKALFFTALITPVILLVLYVSFLGNIYKDSLVSIVNAIGDGAAEPISLSDKILNGFVGGQLISSILAVSCVTVSVCCNMLMVSDKANGVTNDLLITPVRPSTLALSYYISTLISTFIISFFALGISLVYLAAVGFFLSALDVLLLIGDVIILVMLGTALSSVICFFLSTQGQISAVGSIISSTYGFICGAYMPISQFGEGLRNVIGFLPGTYGTSLLRRHTLRAVTEEMTQAGISAEGVRGVRDSVDYYIYVFDTEVSSGVMYAVLIGTVSALIVAYIFLNYLKSKGKFKK